VRPRLCGVAGKAPGAAGEESTGQIGREGRTVGLGSKTKGRGLPSPLRLTGVFSLSQDGQDLVQ
jgi:hypothetical protein